MRNSLEANAMGPPGYSGVPAGGWTPTRNDAPKVSSFARRTTLRSFIDLTSPEPTDAQTSDDESEIDDTMEAGDLLLPSCTLISSVTAPAASAASSSSSPAESAARASAISTDGASTSDVDSEVDEDEDEQDDDADDFKVLPWRNDVSGSPPPRYTHLTHSDTVESDGYKALPRLLSQGCDCHSKGSGKCGINTCPCRQLGTAKYKYGRLVASDVRKSNSQYRCSRESAIR